MSGRLRPWESSQHGIQPFLSPRPGKGARALPGNLDAEDEFYTYSNRSSGRPKGRSPRHSSTHLVEPHPPPMPHGQHSGSTRGNVVADGRFGNPAHEHTADSISDSRRVSAAAVRDSFDGTIQRGSQTDRALSDPPSPRGIPGHKLHILSNGQHLYTPRYRRSLHPGSPGYLTSREIASPPNLSPSPPTRPSATEVLKQWKESPVYAAWSQRHEQSAARQSHLEAMRRQQDRMFHARLLDSSVQRFKQNRKIIKAATIIQRHVRKWLARRHRRLVGGLAIQKANQAAGNKSKSGGAAAKMSASYPQKGPGLYRKHPTYRSYGQHRPFYGSDEELDPRSTQKRFEHGIACGGRCLEFRLKKLGLADQGHDVTMAAAAAVAVACAHRKSVSGGRDPASMAAHHHQRAREAAHEAALATDRQERVRAWRRAHLEELAALQHTPQQVPVFHLSPELARKSARMRAIQERP